MAIVQDRQVPCQGVLAFGRAGEIEQCEGEAKNKHGNGPARVSGILANHSGYKQSSTRVLLSSASGFDISTLALLNAFYGHVTKFFEDLRTSPQGPPIIQIDLHRSPHGDPAGNCKAFSHDCSPGICLMTQQCLAQQQTHRQEQKANEQTCATFFQKALKLQVSNAGTMREMVVDGCFDQFLWVFYWPLL